MKLSACRRLTLRPIHAIWYRAIATKHWKTALKTDHTPQVTTRFSPGEAARTPFEILYLAENQLVALYEVGAIFGPPERPVPNPHQSKMVPIDVSVLLQSWGLEYGIGNHQDTPHGAESGRRSPQHPSHAEIGKSQGTVTSIEQAPRPREGGPARDTASRLASSNAIAVVEGESEDRGVVDPA
jgi:hypothetical protein